MFLASFYSIHALQCKQISCIVLKSQMSWCDHGNSTLSYFFPHRICEESLNVCSQGGSWDLERADQGTGREEQQVGAWEQPAEEPGEPRAAGEVSVTSALRVQPLPGASGAGVLRERRAPVQQHGICCISGSAMGRAEPQLSPEMGLQICNFKMKLLYRWKPDLKWKHSDKWPSSVIWQSLRINAEKREWCRRLRLLYNGTDVPLARKGGPSLAFPWSLLRRDGEGFAWWSWPRVHLWPIQVKPRKCIRPCETPPPQPHLTQAIRDSRSCPPCHWSLVLWTFLSSHG